MLVCRDIDQNDDNSVTLKGVTDSIVLDEIPGEIPLVVYLTLEVEPGERSESHDLSQPIHISVDVAYGSDRIRVGGWKGYEHSLEESRECAFTTEKWPVFLPGIYTFTAKVNGEPLKQTSLRIVPSKSLLKRMEKEDAEQ
jgi:hypothetical protein